MLDHIGIGVRDLAASKKFYTAALLPIGYSTKAEYPEYNVVGMGDGEKSDVWFSQEEVSGKAHLAFVAKSRADVDAFYAAAIAAGGKDNGKPGIREQYSPTYYAAFVHDPDGNNIEVVCHTE
jgi:catechol 2,3-dioxygenase-like lactoylglutathione lyase family enzyme